MSTVAVPQKDANSLVEHSPRDEQTPSPVLDSQNKLSQHCRVSSVDRR